MRGYFYESVKERRNQDSLTVSETERINDSDTSGKTHSWMHKQ